MRKLRWLEKCVQKLTQAVPTSIGRLVHDGVVGSVVAGSVVLSAIARSLKSDKRGFEATLERLSRGLRKENLEVVACVGKAYRYRARRWLRDVFNVVALDLSDLIKPYGRKMPLLCRVRDGSNSTQEQPVIGLEHP